MDKRVIKLVQEGKFIQAVQSYMFIYKVGLKKAKNAIDEWRKINGV